MDLLAGIEMDLVDFVQHITQQVAALHAVVDTAEHRGDDVAAIPSACTLQIAQICEKARTLCTIVASRPFFVNEFEQGIPGNAVGHCRPVAPTVGYGNRGPETLSRKLRLLLAH